MNKYWIQQLQSGAWLGFDESWLLTTRNARPMTEEETNEWLAKHDSSLYRIVKVENEVTA